MNLKNVKKAASLVAKYSEKTAISKAKNENVEVLDIVRKKIERARFKTPEIHVNEFCRELVKNRLRKIAKALPDEGYSMGSTVSVSFLSGNNWVYFCDDRTSKYSNSCKYRPTHGSVKFHINNASELRKIHVIGGLVTIIEPGQKSKVKKCSWYFGEGSKNRWNLSKIDGFICGDFHASTKEAAKEGFERNEKSRKEYEKRQILAQKTEQQKKKLFAAALRKQFTFQDSLFAGNCEVGTRAFILRCGLDINKKYRGKYLLEIAKAKSTSSVSFVERMINWKMAVSSR